MIETIHFVAGLGAEEQKPLTEDKLLAMRLAKKHHPDAQLFLHTSQAVGTCDNYPAYVRRITHPETAYAAWPAWQMLSPSQTDSDSIWSKAGAQQSDKLRLHVLLTCKADNALYLDTDAYCVKSLDWLSHIEGCAMARLNPFMVANGLIYAGRDRSFLDKWTAAMQSATKPPKSYVDWSCRMPHDLAQVTAGLTVLDSTMYHGVSGDEAVYGRYWQSDSEDVDKVIARCAVVHTMGCRTGIPEKCNYATAMQLLQEAAV